MKFVFSSVSENGENGLYDEGADGAMPLQNFWSRTAPEFLRKTMQRHCRGASKSRPIADSSCSFFITSGDLR